MNIETITAEQTRPLRRQVLKPGLPESEVHYEADEDAATIHLGAIDNGVIIGIATFFRQPAPINGGPNDWRLRGMATAPAVHGRGIGSQVLQHGIEQVRQAGAHVLWCNGRTTARRFYERLGFVVVGDEFMIPGTGPHYVFVLALAPDGKTHGGGDNV